MTIARIYDSYEEQEAANEKLAALAQRSNPEQLLCELLPVRSSQKANAAMVMQVLTETASQRDAALRWNLMTQEVEVEGRPLSPLARDGFYVLCQGRGYDIPKGEAIDALRFAAHGDAYHPVQDYLLSCRDQEPYDISRLASQFLRPADLAGPETIYDRMLVKTLVGAVRRAFEPGCQHDTCLVLQGEGGSRKTSFWRTLFDPWFTTFRGRIGDRDGLLTVHRFWGLELGELDGITSQTHAGHLKNFLSTNIDSFRPPYGRSVAHVPRPSVFVGSCNEGTFLVDPTGNRRWWIIPVTRTRQDQIDTDTLARLKPCILAEAYRLYENGYTSYLNDADERQNDLINDEFNEYNPLEESLNGFIRGRPDCPQIAPSELYEHLNRTCDISQKMTDRRIQNLVKSHMTRAGWSLKRIAATKTDKTRPRRWCRSLTGP